MYICIYAYMYAYIYIHPQACTRNPPLRHSPEDVDRNRVQRVYSHPQVPLQA